MRIANLAGRLTLVVNEAEGVDVAEESRGLFGPDPQRVYDDWDAFRDWARTVEPTGLVPLDRARLEAPVPSPRQVFAVGVNYAEHAREAGYPADAQPIVFTKFATSLCGPETVVTLPSASVDWEVEMVVIIGRGGHRIGREEAWDHVAGMMVGQDLSDRELQMQGTRPQFSLGKSWPRFGPTGPWLVTPDELPDPDDLALRSILNGTVVQESRTSYMIDDVAALIAKLSAVCPLLPGDMIFTGTPDGVGNARTPKWFLTDGDVLVSEIEGLGQMTTSFVSETAGSRVPMARTGQGA